MRLISIVFRWLERLYVIVLRFVESRRHPIFVCTCPEYATELLSLNVSVIKSSGIPLPVLDVFVVVEYFNSSFIRL